MNRVGRQFCHHFLRDQRGQALPWMALIMVLFLGFAGLTIDLGRAFVCLRELQASTDSAALAGAYEMSQTSSTVTTVNTKACTYSSNTTTGKSAACSVTGNNANTNMPTVVTTPTLACAPTSGYVAVTCAAAPLGYNVIHVIQTATIKTYFIGALGTFGLKTPKTLTLNAESSATLTGSSTQVNVAVIVDTTNSMGQDDTDPNCNNKRIICALNGIQTMLGELTPCTAGSSKTSCLGAYDSVALFTFPNIAANSAQYDTTCPTGKQNNQPVVVSYYGPTEPTAGQTTYTAPDTSTASPTYQVTTFQDNYSSTNLQGGAVSPGSGLGIATGAGTCPGMQTPGGVQTYYAGAIMQAQAALMAQQAANPGSENVMIILSDGAANSGSFQKNLTANGTATLPNGYTYPSASDQCNEGVGAANYATSLGTTVYTIAYGASSNTSDCSSDTQKGSLITPCQAMQEMSSGWPTNTSHFYSDSTASEAPGGCPTPAGSPDAIDDIFSSITSSFSKARLIPNS